jgi:oligopeptide transport system substrate-binding protein
MKYLCFVFFIFLICCSKNDRNLEMKNFTLRTCLRIDPISLDPAKGNDMAVSQIHFMLYEGLYQLDPSATLLPAQAKSHDLSPDRKTYTFHLAETKWSDGTPVTAYDFERSWKRILDPEFPSPDAYLLYCVKNAKEAKKKECSSSEIAIHAQDAKTLIVELEYPTPCFLQITASSVLLPVHPNPNIFNGPFTLAKWDFNNEIVLDKNPNYRLANKVKLHHISLEIIDREMATLHMYASGHFDLIGAPLSFFPSILSQDLKQRDFVVSYPVATTKFLAFNTQLSFFSNANVRKAFSYAIDRHAITKNITQFNEKEAESLVPPLLLDFEPSSQKMAETAQIYLNKGLQELQLTTCPPITFMYVSSEINHLLVQELQSRWASFLGVKVRLESVDYKILHERSEKGDFAIGLFALSAEYADPMNILERFQDKANHRNYSKWENQHYKDLLEKATMAVHRKDYDELIQKAAHLLAEEMPVAPLFHENYLFLMHPHVKGFAISPLGHIFFERLLIEK